jgi:hypothetical protein
MTARKPTTTFLLILTLTSALALSGCNPFSSSAPSEGGKPPAPQANTPSPDRRQPATQTNAPSLSQAQEDFKRASAKFESADRAAKDARKKADDARADAEKLEGVAHNNNVNVNDPSSRTFKARALQGQLEDDAQQKEADAAAAQHELDTATANLSAARGGTRPPDNTAAPKQGSGEGTTQGGGQAGGQPVGQPVGQDSGRSSGQGEDTYDFMSWLLPGIGALVGLLVLGGLFWWTWATIQDGNEKLAKFINQFSTKSESDKLLNMTTTGLKETSTGIRELSGKVAALQSSVFNLSQKLDAILRESPAGRGLQSPPPTYDTQPAGQDYDEPSYAGDGDAVEQIEFPIAAASFLSRVGDKQMVVKLDPLKGILVKDPEGRGSFALVRDPRVSGSQYCIIPRAARFQALEDFYNNYEQFYDCSRPASGEVWVKAPTVVVNQDGGWRLHAKGELEVK